jgi:SRSO17 transposase
VATLREQRPPLVKQVVGAQPLILCMDETGEKNKGKTMDDGARHSMGNLGKIGKGMVSVHAYGVVDEITFPVLLQVFKPRQR